MSEKTKTMDVLLEESIIAEEERPYEIPENWIWTNIDTVAREIKNGTTIKQNKEGLGVGITRIESIQKNKVDLKRIGYIEDLNLIKTNDYYLLHDIALSHINSIEHVGKTALIEESYLPLVHGMNLLRIRLHNNEILPMYAQYYMTSYQFRKDVRDKINRAVNQVSLNQKKLKEIPFPLPPLGEQKRIAEKVERFLGKIDESKRLIDEAKETFELRRAAIIKSILEDGIVDKKLPEGWKTVKIKDLFTIFGGGTPSKAKDEYWNGNIPWISAKDMKTTFISETMDYITENGLKNSSAKLAKRNSVVMVVRSGILQRTLPIAYLLTECTVNQDLKVFDSGHEIINKYFLWYVMGNEQKLLKNYSKSGTTVNSIEFDKFKCHEIVLPPLDVLARKIERIEYLVKKESEINEVLNATSQFEVLKTAVLSTAFKGQLGTNDPSEERAFELLKEVLQGKLS